MKKFKSNPHASAMHLITLKNWNIFRLMLASFGVRKKLVKKKKVSRIFHPFLPLTICEKKIHRDFFLFSSFSRRQRYTLERGALMATPKLSKEKMYYRHKFSHLLSVCANIYVRGWIERDKNIVYDGENFLLTSVLVQDIHNIATVVEKLFSLLFFQHKKKFLTAVEKNCKRSECLG